MNQRNQKWQVPHFVWAFGYTKVRIEVLKSAENDQLKCNTAGDFFLGVWKSGTLKNRRVIVPIQMAIWGIRYTKNIQKRYTPFQTHPYIIHITVRPTDRLLLRIAELSLSLETLEKWSQHVSTHWTRDSIHCRNLPTSLHGTWTSSGWHCRLREPCYHRGRYPQTTAINFDARIPTWIILRIATG